MNVLAGGESSKPPQNMETLEEQLNKSQEALSNSNVGANAQKKKKRGHTHKTLTLEEE